MSKMSLNQRIRKRYNRFSGLVSVRCLGAFHPWRRWLVLHPGATYAAGFSGTEPHFRWRRPVSANPLTAWSNRIGLHLKLTTANIVASGRESITTIRHHYYKPILHRDYVQTQHNNVAFIGSGPVTRETLALPQGGFSEVKNFSQTVLNISASSDRHDYRPITQYFKQHSRLQSHSSIVTNQRPAAQTFTTHRMPEKNGPVATNRCEFAGPLDGNAKTPGQKVSGQPILLREIRHDRNRVIPPGSVRVMRNPTRMAVMKDSKSPVTIDTTINSPQFESIVGKTMWVNKTIIPAAITGSPQRGTMQSNTPAGPFEQAVLTSNPTRHHAIPQARVEEPRLIYPETPPVAASNDDPQHDAIRLDAAAESSEEQLEQKIAQVIGDRYRHFEQKPVNAKRVARDALSKLERQLVREQERLGRIV